jgi:hypothetical protein
MVFFEIPSNVKYLSHTKAIQFIEKKGKTSIKQWAEKALAIALS